MDIEKYRDLVSKDNTMSSRDLHEFVYEATGKFERYDNFMKKIATVLEAHIANSKMELTLRDNGQVDFYNMKGILD